MSRAAVRVLIVDDSAVVRGLLARAIEQDAELQLVGTAMHGEAALSTLRRSPADVVVLDVEMPVMDGLTALKRIQAEFPHTRVVMASALTGEGADATCRALALGAVDCFAKPMTSSISASIEQLSTELLPLLRAVGAGVNTTSTTASKPTANVATAPPAWTRGSSGRRSPRALVIGSSTGGPRALREVLCSLPSDFPLPIFIVQHMPATFTPMLAKHLAADTRRPCSEASHREIVRSGHTYVAPGGFHLELERADNEVRMLITSGPQEHFCRPSVNPLFRSAASVYGAHVMGVMLTGMGEDGIEGSRELVAQGGRLLAQDEASSIVWGMPGAVVRAGLAEDVLPLNQIGPRLVQTCLSEVVTR